MLQVGVTPTIRSSNWVVAASAILLALLGSPEILAQPVPRTVPLEEQVKKDMENSRFHLGAIRLFPTFSLANAGYNNNLFGTRTQTVSDYTATVSAGFRSLLPVGPKMYLRGEVSPAYYWYAHHVQQRSLGGRYAASWLGFFNWMSTDLSGGYSKSVNRLSSENESFVTQAFADGFSGLEVSLSRRWSLFASGDAHRLRYSSDTAFLSRVRDLDRDDYGARAGIRYRLTTFFDVAAEAEGTRTTFIRTSKQRDNETRAYLVKVHYDRPRLFVDLTGGYRDGRPYNGSTFAPFATATGSYLLSYHLGVPVEVQAYGHRGPGYSLSNSNAYFIETRNGLGLTLRIGYRLQLHGFGDFGTNKYSRPFPTAGTFVFRKDRATNVGGGLTANLFRNASLLTLVTQTKLSSNIPGLGRSILRFTTNLSFEGTYPR